MRSAFITLKTLVTKEQARRLAHALTIVLFCDLELLVTRPANIQCEAPEKEDQRVSRCSDNEGAGQELETFFQSAQLSLASAKSFVCDGKYKEA